MFGKRDGQSLHSDEGPCSRTHQQRDELSRSVAPGINLKQRHQAHRSNNSCNPIASSKNK